MMFMKRIIKFFILMIILLFISIWVIVLFDKSKIQNLKLDILDNTDIKKIVYLEKYDNYYLVMDEVYLYLLDAKYKELERLHRSELYDNKYNYELIYKDGTIMYMNNYKNEKGITFKYYDIYTYELMEEITLGGN